MASDELDDRVRQAAEADPEAVDRVLRAALSSPPGRGRTSRRAVPTVLPMSEWPAAFGLLTACLVAVVSLGVWWCAKEPPRPSGPGSASRVIAVRLDDGTTWILGPTPTDDWLPAGGAVVFGGGEGR